MNSGLNDYLAVIEEFAKLPKRDTSPTFMEICKYPYSRFEEVCSRILQFFFDPKAGHGFGNLWLSSLLDLIGDPRFSDTDDVKVLQEENADGKRIDLTIVSDKFVIGIENKTTANVYNPLDVYKKHISSVYRGKFSKLMVLSVRPIMDDSIRRKLEENEFKSFTYRTLFSAVREKSGNYLADCNREYLTYMLDFMKTIDNMDNSISRMENDFFFKHKDVLEELIARFNGYNARILTAQKEQISILRQRISDMTGGKWWAFEGWDLGINFNETGHRIGIESNFEADRDDPCAFFHICVTTWKMNDWFPYKERVLERFPEKIRLDEYKGNRSYLRLPILPGNDQDKVVEALKRTYEIMTEITSEIH